MKERNTTEKKTRKTKKQVSSSCGQLKFVELITDCGGDNEHGRLPAPRPSSPRNLSIVTFQGPNETYLSLYNRRAQGPFTRWTRGAQRRGSHDARTHLTAPHVALSQHPLRCSLFSLFKLCKIPADCVPSRICAQRVNGVFCFQRVRFQRTRAHRRTQCERSLIRRDCPNSETGSAADTFRRRRRRRRGFSLSSVFFALPC